MTDIAGLVIKVTTSGVKDASTELDKLATSGDKAAKSTDGLNKVFNQGGGIEKPAKAAAQAFNQQTAALAKLAGQIDPTVAKLDKLDKLQEQLGKFKKGGMISADDFTALNGALDASRAKIGSAGEAVHKFSLNNSLARRELGYLAKDLATGQYGRFQQSALTLANASGVMALAFSGIGLAVGGAVVALGAFAVAAFKGSEEAERLRTSVIATGGAAGVSAAGFNDMAVSVGAVTGQWGDARKAVEAFAASGKVAGAGIGGLARQAVNMATVTGESIDKAVAKIIELNDKPAATIANLNEQYHFLTSAQYAMIAALEDEGKTREAGRMANQLDARAMADRAKDVEDNANWMIRSAHAVANAWGATWTAMKGGDSQGPLGDASKALQDQIDKLTQGHQLGKEWMPGISSEDPRVKRLQAQLTDVRRQQVSAAFSDNAKELAARADADAISAQKRLSAYRTPKETLDNQIKKANSDRLAALYGIVDPAERSRISKQADDQIKAAQIAYAAAVKKLAGPKGPKDPEVSAYKAFSGQVDALNVKAIADTNPSLEKYKQGIAKLGDELNVYMKANGDATKASALFLTGQKALQAELDRDNAQNTAALRAYQESIDQQISARQQENDLQVQSIGMGAKEAQQLIEIARIRSQVASTIEQLNRQRAQNGANVAYIDAEIAAQKASIPVLVKQENEKYSAMDRARANWVNGAKRAYANILDSASDVAGQTDQLFTNAFDSMGNALANFATTGKLDFKGLVASILSDLAKMEIRIAASKLLQMFVGGMNTPSGYNSASSSQQVAFDVSQNANGGVYSSPSLSAYSGQIVSRPTAFAFAKGAGIMGEAGPEAIMPLSRGADGKLGVKASGGAGGDMTVNQTFVVDSNGGTSGKTSGSNDDSIRQFAGKMKGIAQQAIMDEQRPGGSLWRMRQGA